MFYSIKVLKIFQKLIFIKCTQKISIYIRNIHQCGKTRNIYSSISSPPFNSKTIRNNFLSHLSRHLPFPLILSFLNLSQDPRLSPIPAICSTTSHHWLAVTPLPPLSCFDDAKNSGPANQNLQIFLYVMTI